ncbi:MAG: tetratricopeptide repeat protein [Lachnospiraceae bacterium]|nr:tetratricopeptide repeat protein [Lachnospiraceae bacterium]
MTCIKCGKEIMDGSVFCRYCGTPQADDSGSDDETVLLPGRRPGKASEGEKTPDEAKLAAASVSKKKNLLPFLIGGIAAVVVLAVLIFAVSAVAVYNSPEKKYDRQLSLAERYLDDLDYEKAIAAYKAAIEIDPNNPEAYKALAELYLAMDDSVSAQETVQAGINASSDAGLSAMLTEITSGQNTANVTNETVPVEPQIFEGNVTVKVMAANETGAICSAEVKLTGAAGEFSGETDSDGKVSFSDLEYGEYTVKCDAEGFHKREMTVNVSGTDVSSVVALVPDVAGDDAYVLLTWNGEHDLDLCAFNTEMKEYVNIGHPIDSAGNVFLYADHGADMPYEVIYLHNASAEIAKTFYVADVGNARNGSSSQMEADGVTILVYDSTGLIYESTADTSESAPLWCPCYYYAGTVYDQQDYIYDTTGEEYAWISFDEKDAVAADAGDPAGSTAQDDSWKTAYLEIVNEHKKIVTEKEKEIGLNYSSKDSQQAALIYLNDDDIPELVIKTFGQSESELEMLSYVDGSSLAIAWSDVIEYYPRAGMYYGNEDCDSGWVGVCSWNGKEGTVLWESGLWDMDSEEPVISDEEVEKNVAKYFDRSRATNAMKDSMTFDEMIAYLSGSSASDKPDAGQNSSAAVWKSACEACIRKFESDNAGSDTAYSLIYLNNDDIPELAASFGPDMRLYSYINGSYEEVFSHFQSEGDWSGAYYIPRSGYIEFYSEWYENGERGVDVYYSFFDGKSVSEIPDPGKSGYVDLVGTSSYEDILSQIR